MKWLALILLCGCATAPAPAPTVAEPADAPSPTSVTFQGRSIDIEPHIAGYPYRSFKPFPELGVLLYMHEGDTRQMMKLPLTGDLDPALGTPVNDVDWNSRNLGSMKPLPAQNALLFLGDEDNQEFYDAYKLHLQDGRIEKLTDVPYIYGWGLDHAEQRLAYIARYPIEGTESFKSCVEIISVDGGPALETVVCDTPERTFTWGSIHFTPDDGAIFFSANLQSDRARKQLLRVDLTAKERTVVQITDETPRNQVGVLDGVLGENYVAMSDESGFGNLYVGPLAGGAMTQLTTFEEELDDAYLMEADGETHLVAILRRPWESELMLLGADGVMKHRLVVPSNLYSLHATPTEAWFYATSRGSKMDVFRLTVQGPKLVVEPKLKLPADLAGKLEHCKVERVQIPTFDVDEATGEPRLLHAYWSTPKVAPAEGERRLAGIVAFYGGGNYWDTQSQILCQAGVASLSPAVRGSWGFGRDFYGLNDGDLGGDEIIDLHWMAKWLVSEHGYKPRDIGTYGGSHGGYATMRALTFPPETNGRDSDFDFGWGVSFFGFSDIRTFWETCNIPDWVLLEAGDPATEPDKIRERSPLYHLDRLDSPILLLHGDNDQRVPVLESRQFDAACTEAQKDCTYVEFAGQGHGLKGLNNQVRVYREVFGFLEGLPTP